MWRVRSTHAQAHNKGRECRMQSACGRWPHCSHQYQQQIEQRWSCHERTVEHPTLIKVVLASKGAPVFGCSGIDALSKVDGAAWQHSRQQCGATSGTSSMLHSP